MRHIITVAALLAAFVVPSVASAFHSGEVVVGRYRLPKDHRFESPNAQGKYEVVDINDVPRLIREGRFVFDRTGNAWIAKPGGGPINARTSPMARTRRRVRVARRPTARSGSRSTAAS